MRRSRPTLVLLLTLACFAAFVLPVVGGMAELGGKKNQTLALGAPEVGGDLAAGDGIVTLRVNGAPFSRTPAPGETVDAILENIEGQINGMDVGLTAAHSPGSAQITVTHNGGSEVRSLDLSNTDSGFGYVSSDRSTLSSRGALRAVTETPSGVTSTAGPASVRIDANARFVTVATAGHSAGSLNIAIVNALTANSFAAGLIGGRIVIKGDLLTGSPVHFVSWEDNDTGLKSIGAVSEPPDVPTAGEWAAAATLLLMLAGTWLLMRRRRAQAAARR